MSSQPGTALKRALERCQRRFPRYRAEFPVVVTLFSATDRQRLEAYSKDISQAGVGLLIATELNLGEVVSLSFSLPKSPDSWEIRAVLRHRRGYHYGFEFLSPSDEQNAALAGYLHGLEPADPDQGD
jgi:c-di-GMP-binding flagellar brake protein YcgR